MCSMEIENSGIVGYTLVGDTEREARLAKSLATKAIKKVASLKLGAMCKAERSIERWTKETRKLVSEGRFEEAAKLAKRVKNERRSIGMLTSEILDY